MSVQARGPYEGEPYTALRDWTDAAGREVAIYRNGVKTDSGQVEAVTADGNILWLMQDGPHHRRIIEKMPGIELFLPGAPQGS